MRSGRQFKEAPRMNLIFLYVFGNFFHASADREVGQVMYSVRERRLCRGNHQEYWISIIDTQNTGTSFRFDGFGVEKHSRVLPQNP